jgi:1,4-dihydroxy-2-naphthoate octaprenyltransferase
VIYSYLFIVILCIRTFEQMIWLTIAKSLFVVTRNTRSMSERSDMPISVSEIAKERASLLKLNGFYGISFFGTPESHRCCSIA